MSAYGEYVVGIDTGGTYTDGVLLDYRSRDVIAFSKTLTTRENLTIGIIKALNDLCIEDPSEIKLVGISSTLATNSIAEKKTRKVGLLLIGYDRDLMAVYNLEAKLPTSNLAHFSGGHTSQGLEKSPLELEGIEAWVIRHKEDVDALAVSGYFSPLNPSHEERAFAMIRDMCELPVVLGHQLSTKLDSIKRATTACLNASLVAIMHEFIDAVRKSLVDQGIRAPLMIVKGDGSLIPYREAVFKPVDTVLSGPAASAIGGRFLSGHGSALVIDMGGTTTDLALMDNFKVTISENGARVGTFETAVKAARIRTAGIGCDSRIVFESGGAVKVGSEQVVPLSRLASRFPRVEQEIERLKKKGELNRRSTDIEYWFLGKNIDAKELKTEHAGQHTLINLLKNGPLSLTQLLEKMDAYHPIQLKTESLFRQRVIEQSTLTPTDLLHVNGQMDTWSGKAARQAVSYACALYSKPMDAFVEEILDRVVAAIVEEAIIFLARQRDDHRLPERVDGSWGQWLVKEALTGKNPHLAVAIASRYPIIGIGAPAHIFLKRVAESLGARFILPDYAPVANAVGAVAGSVIVKKEALVYAQESETNPTYVVQIDEENARFSEIEDASEYAEQTVAKLAHDGAVAAGVANPQVTVEKRTEGHLQRILARSIGNPKLSEIGNRIM